MSDADDTNDEQESQEQMMVSAGLDPRELAQIARLTDILNRNGVVVHNFAGITPLDYGVMFDLSLYIQTREVPEEAQAEPETDRAADAGEVQPEPVVENIEDEDDDE